MAASYISLYLNNILKFEIKQNFLRKLTHSNSNYNIYKTFDLFYFLSLVILLIIISQA